MTHRHFPFISSDLQPCYSSTDQHTPRPSPSAPQGLTNHRLSHHFTVPTSNDHLHPSDEFCACHKPSHYTAMHAPPFALVHEPSSDIIHDSAACRVTACEPSHLCLPAV